MRWVISVASLVGCASGGLDVRTIGDAGDAALGSVDARAPAADTSPRADAAPDLHDTSSLDASSPDAYSLDGSRDAGAPLSIRLLSADACRDLNVAHVAPDALFGFEVTGPASTPVEIWASRPDCGVAPFLYDTMTLDAAGRGALTRENRGSLSCTDALLGEWTVWASQGPVRSADVALVFESPACGLGCEAAAVFCPPAEPVACAPIVFTIDAPFVATLAEPTRRTNFDVADGLSFGRIDVELDFVRGPWAADHPAGRLGMHNLFWLHRGLRGQDWLDNSVGYLNFTATSSLRLESNLGITEATGGWSDVLTASHATTTEGERYHVEYSYDAEAGRWSVRLSDSDGVQIAYDENAARLDEIEGRSPYPRGTSAFFLEIGHVPWAPDHDGPEVATLGWSYSDVEVRFYPLASTCP